MSAFTTFNGFNAGVGVLPLVAVYNEVFGGVKSRVFHSDDDGATWTESSTVNAVELSRCQFGNGVFMIWDISDGTKNVETSSDDGVTWVTQGAPGSGNQITDMVFVGGAWVGALVNGDVIRSTDNGANWSSAVATTLSTSQSPNLGSDGSTIVAADFNGGSPEISRSTDAGATWNAVASVPASSDSSFSDSIIGNNNSFVMTHDAANGDCIQSADGGVTWTVRNVTSSFGSFRSFNALDSGFLFMSGSKSSANFSSPLGVSWSSEGTTGVDPDQQRSVGTYSNKTFVIGNSGTSNGDVAISTDNAGTWSNVVIWTIPGGETWVGQSICAKTSNKVKQD